MLINGHSKGESKFVLKVVWPGCASNIINRSVPHCLEIERQKTLVLDNMAFFAAFQYSFAHKFAN